MTSRELRDRYGRFAYFIAGLQAIPESTEVHYRVTLDGEEMEMEGFTCLVENAGNMGIKGMSLASDVSISDGLLDVFVVRDFDFKSLTSVVGSIADKPLAPESFRHWQAREIAIGTDPQQPVVVDGESWGETPITLKVLHHAVSVIAPGELPE
jgi:diacylglycerol kinase family enzyme